MIEPRMSAEQYHERLSAAVETLRTSDESSEPYANAVREMHALGQNDGDIIYWKNRGKR